MILTPSPKLQTRPVVLNDRNQVLAAVARSGSALRNVSEELKADKQIVLTAIMQDGRALASASWTLRNDKEIVLAAIQQDRRALEFASPELKNDKEIVLAAVQKYGLALEFASPSLQNDQAIVDVAVRQNGYALRFASEELKKGKELVLAAVKVNGLALKYASPELRNDKDVVVAAVKQNGWALKYASEELHNDREIVLVAVVQDGRALEYATEELQNNRDIVLPAVQQNGWALQCASEELRKDKDIVLAAVVQNGRALQYAGDNLKKDKEVVLAAVVQDGRALEFVSPELRNDKDTVLPAVQQNGYVLKYASPALQKDPVIVSTSLERQGLTLQSASPELRQDKDFMLVAVKHNGRALQFASKELQNDTELVLAAVRQSGLALQYAGPELKRDKDVVLAALKQSSAALRFGGEELKNDKDIVSAAIAQNGSALQYASPSLQNDRDIVLAATQRDTMALQFASKELKRDKEFILAALKHNGTALLFASPELQNNKEVVYAAVQQDLSILRYASPALLKDREFMLNCVQQQIQYFSQIKTQIEELTDSETESHFSFPLSEFSEPDQAIWPVDELAEENARLHTEIDELKDQLAKLRSTQVLLQNYSPDSPNQLAYIKAKISGPTLDEKSVEVEMMINPGMSISLAPLMVLVNELDLNPGSNDLITVVGLGGGSTELIPFDVYIQIEGLPKMLIRLRCPLRSQQGPGQWILGQDFLKFFRHTWIGGSHVDLELLPTDNPPTRPESSNLLSNQDLKTPDHSTTESEHPLRTGSVNSESSLNQPRYNSSASGDFQEEKLRNDGLMRDPLQQLVIPENVSSSENMDLPIPESVDCLILGREDRTPETSKENFNALYKQYGIPSVVKFLPLSHGFPDTSKLQIQWLTSNLQITWDFLGVDWTHPTEVDPLVNLIIQKLQLPVIYQHLPLERNHRNLILHQSPQEFVLQNGNWKLIEVAETDGQQRIKKFREKYNKYIQDQHQPPLEIGNYIVIEEGKEIEKYDSYAEAHQYMEDHEEAFGFTYYGMEVTPTEIHVIRATGGFGGNPHLASIHNRIDIFNNIHTKTYYGYIKMRLVFKPRTTDTILGGQWSHLKQVFISMNRPPTPRNNREMIEIYMMIDTGARVSVGPESILSYLGLRTEDVPDLRGFDGRSHKASQVGLSIELVDQEPSPPEITIPIQMNYRKTETVYTDSQRMDDIKDCNQWLLGQDYLRYFKHLWTGNSYVDLALLQRYLNTNQTFKEMTPYHEAFENSRDLYSINKVDRHENLITGMRSECAECKNSVAKIKILEQRLLETHQINPAPLSGVLE